MRNAALMLGIIGGIIGMIVGFFSYGYTVLVDTIGADVPDLLHQVENVQLVRAMALISPLLAIAGGAMARSNARVGGALMLVSSVGMYYAFGYGFTTMFPIAFCALGGVLALAAVQPDPH